MKEVGRVRLDVVKEQGLVRVPYPPFDILVAWSEGELFAIEDACNHAGASLSEGWMEGRCIACPMHGYVFDLRNGKLLRPRGLCGDQRTYETRVEGEDVVLYETVAVVIVG